MKQLLFSALFILATYHSNAQFAKSYKGLTFFHTDFLIANQQSSDLFFTKYANRERLILNQQMYFQYHFLFGKRLELNAGIGLSFRYYSVKSGASLETMGHFLDLTEPLLPSESNDELWKLKYQNGHITFPVGMKFFFKKVDAEGVQSALSVLFLTERNVYSQVNARYDIGRGYFFTYRSNTSTYDTEIEDFYRKNVTKQLHSLRVGLSIQINSRDKLVRPITFDFHYVHYFESFDSGITSAAKGLACAWKWQF